MMPARPGLGKPSPANRTSTTARTATTERPAHGVAVPMATPHPQRPYFPSFPRGSRDVVALFPESQGQPGKAPHGGPNCQGVALDVGRAYRVRVDAAFYYRRLGVFHLRRPVATGLLGFDIVLDDGPVLDAVGEGVFHAVRIRLPAVAKTPRPMSHQRRTLQPGPPRTSRKGPELALVPRPR